MCIVHLRGRHHRRGLAQNTAAFHATAHRCVLAGHGFQAVLLAIRRQTMATRLAIGIHIVVAFVQLVVTRGLQSGTSFATASGALLPGELFTALDIALVVLGRGLSPGSG